MLLLVRRLLLGWLLLAPALSPAQVYPLRPDAVDGPDLGAVNANVIPLTDNAYDLGSATKQWRDLYLDATGDLKFSARGSLTASGDGDFVFANEAGTQLFTIDLTGSGAMQWSGTMNPRNDAVIAFGNNNDFKMVYNGGSANYFYLGQVKTKPIYVTEYADTGTDYNHTTSHPTLQVQSADAAQVEDFIRLYHDETDATLEGGNGKLLLLTQSGSGVFTSGLARATIAADDVTPDVSKANYFVTSANTGATAITDLDLPTVGQEVTICGGSNTNSSTIADSGNFNLDSAWTASLDSCLVLLVQADNDYVELGRSASPAAGFASPATTSLDMNGEDILLDADGNSYFENGTDDAPHIYLNGAIEYSFGVSAFNIRANALYLSGNGSEQITGVASTSVELQTGSNTSWKTNTTGMDLFDLNAADLASTCTTAQIRIDTGGAVAELCYCQTTDTWYCIAFTDITGPAD